MKYLVAALSALLLMATQSIAQAPIPADSRLKSIVGHRIIRIAFRTDAPPFSFTTEKNEPAGYTIDLCKSIVSSIERRFALRDLKIEWIPTTARDRFSVVASGKADLECGSSSITLARMKDVDFSNIIYVESTGIVVSGTSKLRTLTDLSNRKIAVVSGSSNERALSDQIRLRNINVAVLRVRDRDEGISDLLAGKVDGYAADKLLLVGALQKRSAGLVMLPEDLSVELYAIVVPRGDWALRLEVNTALAEVFRGDRITDLFRKWFEEIGARPSILLGAAYTFGGLPD